MVEMFGNTARFHVLIAPNVQPEHNHIQNRQMGIIIYYLITLYVATL
jgi:hypothetical protein